MIKETEPTSKSTEKVEKWTANCTDKQTANKQYTVLLTASTSLRVPYYIPLHCQIVPSECESYTTRPSPAQLLPSYWTSPIHNTLWVTEIQVNSRQYDDSRQQLSVTVMSIIQHLHYISSNLQIIYNLVLRKLWAYNQHSDKIGAWTTRFSLIWLHLWLQCHSELLPWVWWYCRFSSYFFVTKLSMLIQQIISEIRQSSLSNWWQHNPRHSSNTQTQQPH